MNCKGFTAGLVTGAAIGAAIGMLSDPVTDKCHKHMRHTKENVFRAIGGAIDDLIGR